MARENPSPYCPTPNGVQAMRGRIKAYLDEVLGTDFSMVRGVGIAMQAALASTTPGTDEYSIPSDQDLVILGIQGYLQMPSLHTEPQVVASANVDPSERWFVKAQNCTVQLLHKDRSLSIFDQRALPLSAITPPVGQTMWFPPEMPIIIPGSHRLVATFTLVDSTAAIVGNSTNYGVNLIGALVAKDANHI